MVSVRDLFLTSTKTSNVADSNTSSESATKPAPAFVTIQSLATFPGAALGVVIIWKFFDGVLGIDNRAVPVISSFVIAGVLYLVALSGDLSKGEKVAAFVLAAINGMYLALSVLGIDIGLEKTGVIDQIGGETG
jgi:hypothetical protein